MSEEEGRGRREGEEGGRRGKGEEGGEGGGLSSVIQKECNSIFSEMKRKVCWQDAFSSLASFYYITNYNDIQRNRRKKKKDTVFNIVLDIHVRTEPR